jgi:ribonuclease HI
MRLYRKDCSAQVNQHQGAVFKSFATFSDAQAFLLPSTGTVASTTNVQSSNGQSLVATKTSTFKFFSESTTDSSSSLSVTNVPLMNAEDGQKSPLSIWTDGACRANGTRRAKAGYGVYFGPKDPRNLSEKLDGPVQTNNRAELTVLFTLLSAKVWNS